MLAKPKTALLGVMISYIWKVYPFVTVLILAGLKAIPDVLYDAAEVDGASGFKRAWYITVPQLRNILGTIILIIVLVYLLPIFLLAEKISGNKEMALWAVAIAFVIVTSVGVAIIASVIGGGIFIYGVL